jgi:hypothetical protein
MKPEWMPKDLTPEEKDDFWGENIRVVEGILGGHFGQVWGRREAFGCVEWTT